MDQEHAVRVAKEALDDIIRNAETAKEALAVYEVGRLFSLNHQHQLDKAMNHVCVIIQNYGETAHGYLLELGANGGL